MIWGSGLVVISFLGEGWNLGIVDHGETDPNIWN